MRVVRGKKGAWRGLGRGFTLVEVMVVVGIVGILARVAYPLYKSYVLKARSVEFVSRMEPFKYFMREMAVGLDGGTTGGEMPNGNLFQVLRVYDFGAVECSISLSGTGGVSHMLSYYRGAEGDPVDIGGYDSGAGSALQAMKNYVASLPCSLPSANTLKMDNQSGAYMEVALSKSKGVSATTFDAYLYFSPGIRLNNNGLGASQDEMDAYWADPSGAIANPGNFDFYYYTPLAKGSSMEAINRLLKNGPDPISGCKNWQGVTGC